ncbi:MAG: hypothetical protein K0R63_1672 [Rickettsiales bacterium]|jgi:uncharacterized protein|nr:hypothetical protein [Rickettsiales bacterium]
MDVTPVIPKGKQIITGYGAGNIIVNGMRYTGSLLVFPEEVVEWNVETSTLLTEQLLLPIISRAASIEILLLGTGAQIAPFPPALRAFLKQSGISVDIMDTGAACRTYNVLLSEERRVAAALIGYPTEKS